MRFTRFSIIGILMAVVLGVIAIVPALAADATGAISLSKAFVSPTGEATITVDDADLNTVATGDQTFAFDNGSGASTVSGTVFFYDLTGVGSGEEILGVPTVKVASSTFESGGFNTGAAANLQITVFNAASGVIRVENDVKLESSVLVIQYEKAAKQVTSAKVTGPNAPTGISVSLTETGVNSGKFQGKFTIGSSTSDPADIVQGVAGQLMTIKYTDAAPSGTRSITLQIEDTKPVGSLVSPTHESNTTSLTPKLIVDFTDLDSKVDEGTAKIVIDSASRTSDATDTLVLGTVDTAAVANGFRVEQAIASGVTDNTTVVVSWHGEATDKAGNLGRTDSESGDSGNQNYQLIIDKEAPAFSSATVLAGQWYNTATSRVMQEATESSDTTISIEFAKVFLSSGGDLKETLNADTVSPADFIVDDVKLLDGTELDNVTPSAAVVHSGKTSFIFLTVPAMAPNATPKVTLKTTSGGISDMAGNSTSAETAKSATDGQAPTIITSLNRSLDDKDATITITTNETGLTPTVTANGETQTVKLIATNTYEADVKPTKDGAWSIQVIVNDSQNNATTVGSIMPKASFPKSSDLALYIDSVIPEATVTADGQVVVAGGSADDLKVEESIPFFLTLDFGDEGDEYGLNSGGSMVASGSSVDDDLDTHAKVTIGTATLDDVDIIGLVDTQDDKSFTLAVLDITTGEHEFELGATDEAGNAVNKTYKFTVTKRKAYELTVSAGWNLISFPGTPDDGDSSTTNDTAIDSVIPATHPATNALTFESGQWLVAQRAGGGTWEGTLTNIDGDHAYWVNTSSSEPVASLLGLTSVGTAATLPSIAVTSGWNLVPVIDLAQTKIGSGGDTRLAKDYFVSVSWSVAYTYSATSRTWTRLTPTSGNVINGQGVWIWVNRAGTLIP